jgi:hypothetical protein
MTHFPDLVLVLMSLLSAEKEIPPGWSQVLPSDKSCSVVMPGAPKSETKSLKTSEGKVAVTNFATKPENGRGAFLFSYSEPEESFVKPDPPQARLDRARDGLVKSSQGKIIEEKKLTLQNHSGVEITLLLTRDRQVRVRIYVVQNRVYQLFVIGDRIQVESGDAVRFLDSLKIQP